jgi:hypothetical protein
VTLLEAIANPPEPGALVQAPFFALHRGERVLVRCVLERTAVYERAGERHTALFAEFELEEVPAYLIVPPDPGRARAKRGREMSLRRATRREPTA